MITNPMAQALRNNLVPASEKFEALVTLLPDGDSATDINCKGCWWKPLDIKQTTYSGINIEGSERIINIPAEEVNLPGGRQEIRRRDKITVNGVEYRVLASGLRSVSSRWECLVNEVDGV